MMAPVYRLLIFPFLFLLIATVQLRAENPYCAFDAEVRRIYELIVHFDFSAAKKALGNKADQHPNKAYLLLDNSIDYYRHFMLEEKQDLASRKALKDKRIQLLKKSGLSVEWKRFIHAEMLLHWAMIMIKHGDMVRGIQHFHESVGLLESNIKEHPDFIYTYKSIGVLHSLLATIPEGYQWAAKLVGLSGNYNSGKAELERFIRFAEKDGDMFLEESYGALVFLQTYLENKPEKAYQYWVLKMGMRDPNPVFTMVQSHVAMRAGYNDAAINILESLPAEQRDRYPYLNFLLGIVRLQKIDPRCERHFQSFLKLYKGDTRIKESYQKMAWNALLQGNRTMYHLNISRCLNQGAMITDDDQQAYDEAKSGKMPDSVLLRARLLCDGGYGQKAQETLMPFRDAYYKDPQRRLETAYRLGRIYQLKKENDAALNAFEDTWKFDPAIQSYMAANALLQAGFIHETAGRKQQARNHYEKLLQSKPLQYRKSLHQKAKSGLARLN
ncbi:MAG TPA: hypothetical protein VFX48_02610 [Saprospiraceae bacterium]|nr:hypothetical protein [Saprospiraceae bacterium]